MEESPWYVAGHGRFIHRPTSFIPVAEYIFAQVMGGVVGAALTYAQYIHAIDIFEGGRHIRTQATAGLFSSFAVSVCFGVWIYRPSPVEIQLSDASNIYIARLSDTSIMLLLRILGLRYTGVYDHCGNRQK